MLTANDLGLLGNVERIPDNNDIDEFIATNDQIRSIVKNKDTRELHRIAREYLDNNKILSAWKVLLINTELNGNTRKN